MTRRAVTLKVILQVIFMQIIHRPHFEPHGETLLFFCDFFGISKIKPCLGRTGKQILGGALLVFLDNRVPLKTYETCHIRDRGYCPRHSILNKYLFTLAKLN